MSKYSVKYIQRYGLDPITKRQKLLYFPCIDLIITGFDKPPEIINCLIDSGVDYNVFPYDYATQFLGISVKDLEKGPKLYMMGIGGYTSKEPAYGYEIRIQHACFNFKTWVYFLKKHTVPLLGRSGFIDRFKSVTFDEKEKKVIFDTRQ